VADDATLGHRVVRVSAATLSRITMIDGKTLPYEDFQMLDLKDMETLRDTEVEGEPHPFGQGDTPQT
jgi:hypothetical protein